MFPIKANVPHFGENIRNLPQGWQAEPPSAAAITGMEFNAEIQV